MTGPSLEITGEMLHACGMLGAATGKMRRAKPFSAKIGRFFTYLTRRALQLSERAFFA
jgi:hypothetical protein